MAPPVDKRIARTGPDRSQEDVLRRAYGGSDSARASFNTPQYVSYGSVNTPRDFGLVSNFFADIEGMVGSESGTSSLFFHFRTERTARIGVKRIILNRYTDQYVSVSLRSGGGEGQSIPIGVDGIAAPSAAAPTARLLDPVLEEGGYALSGYWLAGYAEFDDTTVLLPAIVTLTSPEAAAMPDASGGLRLPAGRYLFVVSSSQWTRLPYRLQLFVMADEGLRGSVDLSLDVTARIGIASLAGTAPLELRASARMRNYLKLSGTATLEARPRATLRRVSPFG